MRKLIYITGGQRAGKSRFAMAEALTLSPAPLYVATSRHWDADYSRRIARHVAERDARFHTLEIEKYISAQAEVLTGRVAVVDCITLWLTNFFTDQGYNVAAALSEATAEFERLRQVDCTLLLVSNELGMGLHADTEAGRKFTDLQGWMNQHIAAAADEAYLLVSGLAVRLK